MKKIILAPDSFKGTMSSTQICTIMESVIRNKFPKCEIVKIPVADGGEGTVDCLLTAMGGEKMDYKEHVAIIIPSLNPDNQLEKLLHALINVGFLNIVLVNDGSKNTYRTFFDNAQKNYNCKVITHSVNLGKGRALKSAFNFILNELPQCIGAITVDADGQHSVLDTIKCAKTLLENPDSLIMGCRSFKKGKIPFRSKFGNTMTSISVKLFCGISISDTQTGLRGIPRGFMKKLMNVKGERYDYEMNMLLTAREHAVLLKEVPIETIYIENNSASHFNPIWDSLQIYAVFLRFISSSLSSFIVDITIFTLLVSIFKGWIVEYILICTAGARIVSSICNYLLNKNVFKNKSDHTSTLTKYFLLSVLQLFASAFCVSQLYKMTGINETIVKIIIDSLLFTISFQIQREWVFKQKSKGGQA
jgi:glycosyltransferase involved in cell wall biosynthesis